ncbi:hypothetical protein [Candidatus Williamhamiltonella defendens]|nr:hypothetical protein [Candidatus Hamiltonella defensa]
MPSLLKAASFFDWYLGYDDSDIKGLTGENRRFCPAAEELYDDMSK